MSAEPEAVFRRLLYNTLFGGIAATFLWFALTFWVYLESRSVVATAIIGASFSLANAFAGMAFGTFVDRHRRKVSMMASTTTAAVSYSIVAAVYALVPSDRLLNLRDPFFWIFVIITLFGSVAAMARGIVLSTCVTLLVPEERRDRANGQVGMVLGLSFAITSVFSGLVVGQLGMGWAVAIALTVGLGTLVHLALTHIPESEPEPTADDAPRIDIRGAITAIGAVPGLFMLIFLAAFNNFLGGVFMALMDAYGLSLISVEVWGLLWGFISMAFIVGGLYVARRGLGRSPLNVVLMGNLVNWSVCSVFALRSSIVMLTIGMFVWLALIPVIEAAEQTVLQRAIPFEQQGRVFGFAQMVENAASPFTAILIGAFAESTVMPFMTDGRGADWIGGWFGTGPERGLAVIFTMAGLLGVAVTLALRVSRSYRMLRVALDETGRTQTGSSIGANG